MNTMKVEEVDIQTNYLRGPDWTLKNIHLATEWNSLTDACVNCIMVNNFKNHILKELEPETFEYYHV